MIWLGKFLRLFHERRETDEANEQIKGNDNDGSLSAEDEGWLAVAEVEEE